MQILLLTVLAFEFAVIAVELAWLIEIHLREYRDKKAEELARKEDAALASEFRRIDEREKADLTVQPLPDPQPPDPQPPAVDRTPPETAAPDPPEAPQVSPRIGHVHDVKEYRYDSPAFLPTGVWIREGTPAWERAMADPLKSIFVDGVPQEKDA